MHATPEATQQSARRPGLVPARRRRAPERESRPLLVFLSVALLGFSLIGLVAWSLAHSRSESSRDAVTDAGVFGDLGPLAPIGVALTLLLTVAWNVGLAALVIWLLSRVF
jgi:hypothetical protein